MDLRQLDDSDVAKLYESLPEHHQEQIDFYTQKYLDKVYRFAKHYPDQAKEYGVGVLSFDEESDMLKRVVTKRYYYALKHDEDIFEAIQSIWSWTSVPGVTD